jgi:hypothetical protein
MRFPAKEEWAFSLVWRQIFDMPKVITICDNLEVVK